MNIAEIIINLIFLVIGSFISWLITHCYYRKSLKNQQIESSKEITAWEQIIENSQINTNETKRLNYINLGVEEYNRHGTPYRVIETFNISKNEKADIYDAVMIRVKGRPGKSNPYRNN